MTRADLGEAAAASSLAGAPWLLRRMAREFDARGVLSSATTTWMYATYLAHAALYAKVVLRPRRRLPLPASIARPAGVGAAALGTSLCVAGMNRFSGARQVSGTTTGPFVTTGVYRWTRNPQYVGYVGALAGAALARRSTAGLALSAAVAGVFAWWVPVEERHLRREHGVDYQGYLARTPRWLGRAER